MVSAINGLDLTDRMLKVRFEPGTGPIRLGFTHAQHPAPSEDLGQSIALWLVEEMNDGSDMSSVKVPSIKIS